MKIYISKIHGNEHGSSFWIEIRGHRDVHRSQFAEELVKLRDKLIDQHKDDNLIIL
jgi:hypothetical protein